jgi:hypothetical protein
LSAPARQPTGHCCFLIGRGTTWRRVFREQERLFHCMLCGVERQRCAASRRPMHSFDVTCAGQIAVYGDSASEADGEPRSRPGVSKRAYRLYVRTYCRKITVAQRGRERTYTSVYDSSYRVSVRAAIRCHELTSSSRWCTQMPESCISLCLEGACRLTSDAK